MRVVTVLLLTAALPIGSALAELHFGAGGDPALVAGRWFVFWAVGVRLLLSGLRQTLRPRAAATAAYGAQTAESAPVVRELGFANLAIAAIGLISLGSVGFLVPAALVGVVYYGLAGAAHLLGAKRGGRRVFDMTTDIFVFLALSACVVSAVAVF